MERYTKKTDYLGHTTYFDQSGRLLGKEEYTCQGERIICDLNNEIFGKIRKDSLGRETIITVHTDLYGRHRMLLNINEAEEWEMW